MRRGARLEDVIGVHEHGPELFAAWQQRSAEVVDALRGLDSEQLLRRSALPGWDRLTIACHLRYGAHALHRMTVDALGGRPTAYYPAGRGRQRPATLQPRPAESGADVVDDLGRARTKLRERWSLLEPSDWSTPVVEPVDNRDLGEATLGVLVMAALTENEVHGSDLDIGLADWGPTFVRRILPARLEWLRSRRTNHRDFDRGLSLRWLLVPDHGHPWLVTARGEEVTTEPADRSTPADAMITGTSRDLLAMLLGRPPESPLAADPDDAVDTFQRAFPGP
jgi:uncharacterized protein (TIGR03083 family)